MDPRACEDSQNVLSRNTVGQLSKAQEA